MQRQEAIDAVSLDDLAKLPPKERTELLEVMLLQSWDEHPQWQSIAADVKRELDQGELVFSPDHKRYDQLLLLWLPQRYQAATNSYLKSRLLEIGRNVTDVTGQCTKLEPCPCCGFRTIHERSNYDICRVCWWEDDGQDDANADVVMGGPNYHLSLTQARCNFLTDGISDPAREDLRELQDPPNMYEHGRRFVINADGKSVSEI